MIIILMYFLSYPTRSYPRVTIRIFICYLLGTTSSWAILAAWSLIFSGPLVQANIEVSSLALEHVINPGELWFPIGLSADWQSLIRPFCSNQAKRLHLQHNNCFIFLFVILLHWCYGVGDVLNIKRSPYGFNLCLVYAGISSVRSWAFFKKTLHILFWFVTTSIH
jgi:hypothetical protein